MRPILDLAEDGMRSSRLATFFRQIRARLGITFIGAAIMGCTGYVGSTSTTGGPNAHGPESAANVSDPANPSATGSTEWPVSYDGHPSALRRLSRDELLATMTMLTGSAPLRDDLPADQRTPRGAIMLSGTSFIATELSKLKLVIDDFAKKTAPSMLTQSACAKTGQAQRDCLVAWASKLGEQAFRRPLQPMELASFQKIVGIAGSNSSDDTSAVEGLMTAVFFAPAFLYRTEIGTPIASTPGQRALNTNEIAARLSFMTTLAPPDAELLTAAKAGSLSDGSERAKQLARLAATDRGKKTISVFVLEWLGANERKVSTKSAKYLAGLDPSFESSIRANVESAIQSVMAGSNATVTELLTTRDYTAAAPMQEITQPSGMGATASGDNATTERLGLMMHPHVIAAHTKEDGSSPFVLGPFMREAFMCETIPDPPPGAANMARNDVPPGSTTRESLEYRIGAPLCQTCHSKFSQLGYAFLPFDPVGRWVTVDPPTGKPWDLGGTITFDSGRSLKFRSPSDLMTQLANEPQVRGCFGQAALRWMLGRELIEEDRDLVVSVNEVAKQTQGDVIAILRAAVSSPGFVNTTAPR
jgi:hypothetical protein